MELLRLLTIGLAGTILLLSCSKDKTSNQPPDPSPVDSAVNNPPGDFTISLTSVSWDSARISWTQAIDPEGDLVTYKVYLFDSLLASDYRDLNFTYKNLKELTAYKIKIVASDSKQKEVTKMQNFTTKRYFLKFLKKIEYGVISGYSAQETGQMVKGNDGGYIITGKTEPLEQIGEHVKFFVVKIDTLGNEVWKKNYNYNPDGSSEFKLVNCMDGYLIGGGRHFFKIDNVGNLVWHKPSSAQDELINALALDKQGEIYTAGDVASDSSTNLVEASISKYDQNGNLIWNKRFSPSINDEFFDIKVNEDGQLIVLGMTDGNKITKDQYLNGGVYFDFDFWVLSLTGEGELNWSKSYMDPGQAFPENIIKSKEGNYVFTGYTLGSLAIPFLYLQMIDANGNNMWSYYSDDNSTRGYSVAETKDNALIVTGGYQLTYSALSSLFKFDKNGNKLWGKLYSDGSDYLFNKTVIPTDDGGYMINCQKSNIYNTSFETDQIYIFKTDELGEFE